MNTIVKNVALLLIYSPCYGRVKPVHAPSVEPFLKGLSLLQRYIHSVMKKEKHILQTKKVQMSQIELRVIVRKRLMAIARTVPAVGQVRKNLLRCICLMGAKHFPQSGLG
jgi:hypothetical protein